MKRSRQKAKNRTNKEANKNEHSLSAYKVLDSVLYKRGGRNIMNSLIIIGASGHGRVIADIASQVGYKMIRFLDDKDLSYCGKYKVIGKVKDFEKYLDSDFIIGIGNSRIREHFQEMITKANGKFTTLVHPKAVVAEDVLIGQGSVIMAGAVINTGTIIGEGVIINTCSSVDHDCKVMKYSHIAVGAHLSGTVFVGKNTWIGAGATVINNISIISNCFIGAGATVVSDINEEGTYIGLPAMKLVKQK